MVGKIGGRLDKEEELITNLTGTKRKTPAKYHGWYSQSGIRSRGLGHM